MHFVLDEWFEKRVETRAKGYAGIVRYADDAVACFQYKEDAENFLRSVKERLKMFKLEISEGKTKIIEFGRFAGRDGKKVETFDFLGFTHYCSKDRKGKFRAKRKTSRKKFRAKVHEMKQWIRLRMHEKVSETIKLLNIKLKGYYMYYGITDNTRSIRNFRKIVVYMLYRTLNRRTQRNKHNFKWFYEHIDKRIEKPKIYVDILQKAFAM